MDSWLGFSALAAMPQVQSLIWELRSHKPLGATKNKKELWNGSESSIVNLVFINFTFKPISSPLSPESKVHGFVPEDIGIDLNVFHSLNKFRIILMFVHMNLAIGYCHNILASIEQFGYYL